MVWGLFSLSGFNCKKKKPTAFGNLLKANFDETKVCLEEVYNIKKVTFNMIYLLKIPQSKTLKKKWKNFKLNFNSWFRIFLAQNLHTYLCCWWVEIVSKQKFWAKLIWRIVKIMRAKSGLSVAFLTNSKRL